MDLNDNELFPSARLKQKNYDAWKERYQTAPSINVEPQPRQPHDAVRGSIEQNWKNHDQQSSKFRAREALSELIAYDQEHGHPLADPTRDLQAQPYTDWERAKWAQRDGRQMTDAERQQGWTNDPFLHRGAIEQNHSEDRLVHPSIRQERQQVLNELAQPEATRASRDLEQYQQHEPAPMSGQSILAHRHRQNEIEM